MVSSKILSPESSKIGIEADMLIIPSSLQLLFQSKLKSELLCLLVLLLCEQMSSNMHDHQFHDKSSLKSSPVGRGSYLDGSPSWYMTRGHKHGTENLICELSKVPILLAFFMQEILIQK